jgi:hypothetical protein
MKRIIPPIKRNDQFSAVANLQSALLLLVERNIFRTDSTPTPEELNQLAAGIRKESQSSSDGDSTWRLIRIFQFQQGLGDHLNGVVEQTTADRLNVILQELGALNDSPTTDFIVKGTIRKANGEPYIGAIVVRAFDRDLRHEELLGENHIENGIYEIDYNTSQFQRAEKGRADLTVRVFDTGNNLLAESPIVRSTDRETIIDLSVLSSQISEWVAIQQAILPLLEGQGPDGQTLNAWELTEADIEFIITETELNQENLKLWILATQVAYANRLFGDGGLENTFESAFFYGWFRLGLPQQFPDLIRRSTDELLQGIDRAIEQNFIPREVLQLQKRLSSVLDNRRTEERLKPALEGQPANIIDILNAVNPDWLHSSLRVRLADAWDTLDPESNDLIQQFNALEVPSQDQPRLKQTLQLRNLTLNNPALIQALQPLAIKSGDGSLNELLKIESDRWLDLAYTHGTPIGVSLFPEEYAKQLESEIENLLPNDSFRLKLQAGKLFSNNPELREEVASLLQANPDFDILTTNISDFAERFSLPEDTAGSLVQIQELKRLGATWRNVDILMNHGFSSGAQIANYSLPQMKGILGDYCSEQDIAAIHANGLAYQAVALGVQSALVPILYGTTTAVTSSSRPSNSQIESSPTLRSLFGALEQCTCDPCLSVLSPAAYLVDLLRYVDTSSLASLALKQRRSDIYDLELSCENSQIELPHIDLVLEILENAVAFPKVIPLTVGTDAEAQLRSNLIGSEIKTALQETALETLGNNLWAQPDRWSIRQKLEVGATYWVVSDLHRRWVLKAQRQTLGSGLSTILAQGMNLESVDPANLLQWMNSATPHFPIPARSWRSAFLQMLFQESLFNGTSFPASVKTLTINTLEASRHWNLTYTIGGTIRVGPSTNGRATIIISSEDGVSISQESYSDASIQVTIAALDQGEFGGVFSGQFFPYTIGLSKVSTDIWSYQQSIFLRDFYYRPTALTITALSYQNTVNDRDLFVRPQNQNPLAYQELSSSSAVFPWTLPYDQPLTETRALLSKSGVTRLDLLEITLPDSVQMSTEIWVYEQLGFSSAQAKAILEPHSSDDELWRSWGLQSTPGNLWRVTDTFIDEPREELPLDPAPDRGLLERVSIVLQQARIRFVELQSLLATQFITAGQTMSIEPIQECDPSKLWLTNINSGMLDRMHRFIRLWRALGWQIWEVDLVILASGIGANNLSIENLLRIAQLHALHKHLNLPIEILTTCFGGFTNRVHSAIDKHETLKPLLPLYDRIFQNKQIQNPPNQSLAFAATLPSFDEALLSDIATALGVRPADLKDLIDSQTLDLKGIVFNSPPPSSPPGSLPRALPVNQNGLLQIWRNLVLAKALKLSQVEYLAACRMLDKNPFATPADLLLFCREIEFIKQTGVDLPTLERALTNQIDPSIRDPWTLPPEEAVTILTGLQTELRSIGASEEQPLRSLRITEDDLRQAPFTPPANDSARWQRWGLNPVTGSTTAWTVASPYPSPATPPQPVPPLTGPPLSLLRQASVLAQQLGLTLPELQELLETSYLNRNSQDTPALEITPRPLTSASTLAGFTTTNIATYLDRMESFLALQRATALTFRELDMMVSLLGATPDLSRLLNDNAGAALLDIRDRLNLPLDTVIALWGGLSGRQYLAHTAVPQTQPIPQALPYPGVFERLFGNQPPVVWQLNQDRSQLNNPPATWRAEISSLATAFAVEPVEIFYLLNTGIVAETVNLVNLSFLHFWLTLAKALGVTTQVLSYLLRSSLPSISPTVLPTPSQLQQFLLSASIAKQKLDKIIDEVSKQTQLQPAIVSDFLLEKISNLVNGTNRPAVEAFLAPAFLDKLFQPSNISSNPTYNLLIKPLIKLRKLSWLNTVWKADRLSLNWLKGTKLTPGTRDFLGLIPNQLEIANPEIANPIAYQAITYQAWKQTTSLFALVRQYPELVTVLNNYRQKLGMGDTRVSVNNARTILAEAFKLTLSDVDGCAILQEMDASPTFLRPFPGQFSSIAAQPQSPNDQCDPIKLIRLINLLSTLQRLGITVSELVTLTDTSAKLGISTDSSTPNTRLAISRRILRSRFSDSAWSDALREVTNTLRIEQRDRLADYLIWKNNFRDTNALYEHYLIDVQMSPCMRTTRLLQSVAAVQLFIQRGLMNLEPLVSPGSFDAKRWEWMQYYRVWEANRKVFLYPENWLHPELRDDGSEIFQAFESALTQNEPSDINAIVATHKYLDELAEVSQIEIKAAFIQGDKISSNQPGRATFQKTLFLVGRTTGTPWTYFWRKCDQFGTEGSRWSGWKRIEQNIKSSHVTAFVNDAQLHIAWPEVTSGQLGNTIVRIRVCWTRLLPSGWDKVRFSSEADVYHPYPDLDPEWSTHFATRVYEDNLEYQVYSAQERIITSPSSSRNPSVNIQKTRSNIRNRGASSAVFQLRLEINFLVLYPDTGNPVAIDNSACQIIIEGLASGPYDSTYTQVSNERIQTNLASYPRTIDIWGRFADTIIGEVNINVQIIYGGRIQSARILIPASNQPSTGDEYRAIVNAVYFSSQSDPSVKLQEGQRIRMILRGSFKFTQGVWTWIPTLAVWNNPSDSFFFFQSGQKEQIPGTLGFAYLQGSMAAERLWIKKGAVSHELRSYTNTDTYIAQEGENKLLVTYAPGRGSSFSRITPYLLAYTDALSYRRWANQKIDNLFMLSSQEPPHNNRFEINNLSVYIPSLTQTDPRNLNPQKGQHVQFDLSQPNALYNWEVFYHLPIMTASFLSKQHRYADARRWFHFIFNPTTDDPTPGRERFWQFLPFRSAAQPNTITQLLNTLANPNALTTDKTIIEDQIKAWLADPFNPFAIARFRTSAFEWYTVIAYIKNLVEWGDQLFRRDTRESINEATLLYVLAANILGRRPEKIPSRQTNPSVSYRTMAARWDNFSNAWISLADNPLVQAWIDFLKKLAQTGINPQGASQQLADLQKLASIGSMYFCIPKNEKILELWDLVGDRLFKIRNCQNIDGVVRNLPLLDPPIDPELLIRARRAGLSIDDVLADRYAPLPIYRMQALIQKANELCNEVKSLGAALLSAIEKKESEHLSLLRSTHEMTMLKLVEHIKVGQIEEAEANITSLRRCCISRSMDKKPHLLRLS